MHLLPQNILFTVRIILQFLQNEFEVMDLYFTVHYVVIAYSN